MNNWGRFFYALISVSIFISIHAEKPACIDYIGAIVSEIKSMDGVYTKEISAGAEKIKSKVTFYDDIAGNRKHLSISDSKGSKSDVFILKDTLFVIDKLNKTVYFMKTDEYGDISKKMFDINVFESLSMLEKLRETDSIVTVIDKNKKMNINFISDTSNLIYSMVMVRFNKDSLPELIEMYDWNLNIMLQIQYSNFKENLPRVIRTLSKMQEAVIDEKISINKLNVNKPISDKNFEFSRKGYKILSLKDAMAPFLE